MTKKFGFKLLLFTVLLFLPLVIGATLNVYAGSDCSTISGRLSALYDSKTETVTAMVAGYCEGEPVIIGPSTWSINAQEFSNAKAEEILNTLGGNDMAIKKVTKSANTGKEIVAEVVVVRPGTAALVGR